MSKRGNVGDAAKSQPPARRPTRQPKLHATNGAPLCPGGHGPLLSWTNGRWYCPDSRHGGNGRFFSDEEVS